MTKFGWLRLSRCWTLLLLALAGAAAAPAHAEDGYDLWLRYRVVESPWRERYRRAAQQLIAADQPARAELERGISGLLDMTIESASRVTRDGAVILGTPQASAVVAGLQLDLAGLGKEGFVLRTVSIGGHRAIVVAAAGDAGVLYGTFELLRLMQTRQPLERLDVRSVPRIQLRLLNHWDNLDGTVERGYAGASIWDWQKLPQDLSPRYTDYARACASIGINGTLLTNVNADALSLTPAYLEKAAALAGVLRPYGIKVYLAPKFTAPMELDRLESADPEDPAVRRWWHDKVEEIYRYIPDFGGFVVKANSEGQPGPQDYHRTHADGANLFAEALAPHGGVVIWRAFVYSNHAGADRAKQAFEEFAPLDGLFRDNVLVQVKNGPIDFQPREPAHPLFGAMPKTPLMLEVQITKEYLGFATHLAYLGPLYEETLRFDTFARGPHSTVAQVIDGSLQGHARSGMAGVSNVGADRNWTGSTFDQANWYAFGRLAWDPGRGSRGIAEEWARMTFSNDPHFVTRVVAMMMGSREAVVNYMTPLGLAHLMAAGNHYGPGAWQGSLQRADWNPTYYHRADSQGIGFDRTTRGSGAVSQYPPPLTAEFNDLDRTPEKYLLWFHHVPWDYRLSSGRSVWEELVRHYSAGVETVRGMRAVWSTLAPYVDAERYAEVRAFLAIQEREASWWRDTTLAYFQSVSQRPYPAGFAAPAHPLLDEMFQDHAVLQRDRAIPVWGEASPGEELTIFLTDSGGAHGAEVHAVADPHGQWRAELGPEPAGGPYRLTARTHGGIEQSVEDILLGDVWLCSGQSNMEFPVANSLNAAREIAASANDRIRVLSVAHAAHPTPLGHFANPVSWAAAGPDTIRGFSAACYYFARDLQKTVPVPMGLIHASWGGSRIEPWMSAAALRGAGGFDASLDLLDLYAGDARAGNDRMGDLWERWWRSHAPPGSRPWETKAQGDWRAVPEPMRDWKTWGVAELASHDGMLWFRRSATLSKAQAAGDAQLSIGAIDEVDETWVNGRALANSFGYGTERTYAIPEGWLHAGENSIVINVLSTWDAGGMYGPPEHLALRFADGSMVPLGGQWHYQFVPESMGFPPRAPWESVSGLATINNAMIAPLLPYALRGVLWYQGESNAGDAGRYQSLLQGLMADWRRRFGADLPFLIVELPNFGTPSAVAASSPWADLREAQRRAVAADKNAALAVTIDVGEAQELHPPNKQAVGARLARAARHLVYGQPVSPSGPVAREARRSGSAVLVSFDDVEGQLLAYSAPRPIGFELCGDLQDSCRFVDAELSGREVRIEPAITSATRVRFCWGDAPVCNLYDKSGLPAGPFEIAIEAPRP